MGNGEWSIGVAESEEKSPSPVKTRKLIVKRVSDPTAWLAEIDVHSHSGAFDFPSDADIAGIVRRVGPFTPSKWVVAGANTMLLMIPTRETSILRARLASEGKSISAELFQLFNNHRVVPRPGEKEGNFLQRSVTEKSITTMRAGKLAVYQFSDESQMFERLPLP
jgi:hypothetical protein